MIEPNQQTTSSSVASTPTGASVIAVPETGEWKPPVREMLLFGGLLLAVFAFYVVLWRQAPVATLDSPTYMSLARELKAGNITHLHARTPGLPILLALTGSENIPTRALYYVQLILHLLAVALLVYLLRLLTIDPRLVYGMAVVALLPPFVEPAAHADSEALCQFLVVLAVASMGFWRIRRRTWLLWVFGMAAFGAGLVRPTYQLVALVVAGVVIGAFLTGLARYRSLARLTAVLAAPTLLSIAGLGAYSTFNYVRFGFFDTSAYTPYALSTKTASFVEELPEADAELRAILVQHRNRQLLIPFSDHGAQDYIHRAMPEVIRHVGNDIKAFQLVKQANLYLITHKPMSFVIECTKSFAIYWLPFDHQLATGNSSTLRLLWLVLQLCTVTAFLGSATMMSSMAVFAVGAHFSNERLPRFPETVQRCVFFVGVALAVVSYSTAVSCFAGTGIPRYRVTSELLMLATSVVVLSLVRGSVRHLARVL